MNKATIITEAIMFELRAIRDNSTARNPYFDTIRAWDNGKADWEHVNKVVEWIEQKHRSKHGYFATITLTVDRKYDGLHTIDLTAFDTTEETALKKMDKYATRYLENPIIIDYKIENIKLEEVHF